MEVPLYQEGDLLFVDVTINKVKGCFLIDTGCEVSVIGEKSIGFFRVDTIDGLTHVSQSASNTIIMKETKPIQLNFGGVFIETSVRCICINAINETLLQRGISGIDGLIGCDILEYFGAVINFGSLTMHLIKP